MACLLVGCGAAFAVTETLKTAPSPVSRTLVTKVFSPVCRCATSRARIRFALRTADRLTLDLVDRSGRVVATVVDGRRVAKGLHVFFWNGRDAAGRVLPDGSYQPRVVLEDADRDLVLPNPIRIDTVAPRIVLVSVAPRVAEIRGGRASVRVAYRVNEPARALLYVDGRRQVRTLRVRLRDSLVWYGRIDGAPPRPGVYRLRLRAQDLAGNVGRATRIVRVRLRAGP